MSYSTSAAASSDLASATRHQIYLCRHCHRSSFVPPPSSLPSSSTTTPVPRCPYCLSTNLEQMETFSPVPIRIRSPDRSSNPNLDPTFNYNSPFGPLASESIPPNSFDFPNENLWHESNFVDLLANYFVLTAPYFPPIHPNPPPSAPTAKTAIDALAIVKISNEILKNDCLAVCAICKDDFVVNEEVKMLPCKHLYHSGCILPWLENNHTCPVCRFKLPTQDDEEIREELGMDIDEAYVGAARLEDLINDDVDLFGFSRTERQIERSNNHQALEGQHEESGEQHQSLSSNRTLFTGENANNMISQNEDFLLSPTQIGDDGTEFGITGRADSTETVSSWPSWARESIANVESTSTSREEGSTVWYS